MADDISGLEVGDEVIYKGDSTHGPAKILYIHRDDAKGQYYTILTAGPDAHEVQTIAKHIQRPTDATPDRNDAEADTTANNFTAFVTDFIEDHENERKGEVQDVVAAAIPDETAMEKAGFVLRKDICKRYGKNRYY